MIFTLSYNRVRLCQIQKQMFLLLLCMLHTLPNILLVEYSPFLVQAEHYGHVCVSFYIEQQTVIVILFEASVNDHPIVTQGNKIIAGIPCSHL